MRVRTSGDDGLAPVGVLRKGSVVEIPDQFAVKKNGKIDAEASFNNWLSQAGYTNSQIKKHVRNQKQDFYYPIRIVSAAGAPRSSLKGKTLFMALRVLERSHGSLRVKEAAPASRGSPALKPLRGLPRVAPEARPARAARSAETATAPAPAPKAQSQAEPPVYTPPAADDESSDSQTEGSGDPAENCPTCNLPPNPVDDLANAAREQVSNADRSSSSGLQGLSSQFPRNCQDGRFINNDGSYGPLGEQILKQLRRHPGTFLANGAAAGACPNFDKWVDSEGRPDEARRYHFWVYLMTAVFAKESTCREYAPAQGPDGVLAGLGQMPADETRNNNDDSFHGWGNDCAGNMSIASNNIRCSVRRLEAAVDDGRGPYRGALYWSTLRNEPNGMTKALISQYDDCGASQFNAGGGSRRSSRVRHHGRRHHGRRR
jgi:hypothetical protein